MTGPDVRPVAVVLAGGTSRRFGPDKLSAVVPGSGSGSGGTLLERVLGALPADYRVVVVGPERDLARAVDFVREDPPGGGPAAGLVAGLREALRTSPSLVVVLPGDAPAGGVGAVRLVARLVAEPDLQSVVAVDASDVEQPLQLALRPAAARALVAAAGPDGGANASARRLVRTLDPPAAREHLGDDQLWDIDTPAQLAVWATRLSPDLARVLEALGRLRDAPGGDRVLVLALDGRSGAGKSTFAQALALALVATVLPGDDFYAAGSATRTPAERAAMSAADVVATVFDWRRLRAEALEPLGAGRTARYRPFDWEAGDGRPAGVLERPSAPVVVLEGVYAGRPELADLVDLAVYVGADETTRRARLGQRSDDRDLMAWWERGEQHYFTGIRPPGSFALRVGPPGDAPIR